MTSTVRYLGVSALEDVAAEDLGGLGHGQLAAVQRLDDAPVGGDALDGVERRHDGNSSAGVGGGPQAVFNHEGRHERTSAVVDERPFALRRERVEADADAVLPARAAGEGRHRLAPALRNAERGDGVEVALRRDEGDRADCGALLECIHGAGDERLAAEVSKRLVGALHASAGAGRDNDGADAVSGRERGGRHR